MSSVVLCCSVTNAKIRPDFAFRGMARVEDELLLSPDGSLYHPQLGLPLNGLRSSKHGLKINKQVIEGLETKTYMIIAAPAAYLVSPVGWVAIGAVEGGSEAWGSKFQIQNSSLGDFLRLRPLPRSKSPERPAAGPQIQQIEKSASAAAEDPLLSEDVRQLLDKGAGSEIARTSSGDGADFFGAHFQVEL